MTDEGKDADLRIGDPQSEAVPQPGRPAHRNRPRRADAEGTRFPASPGGLSEHTRSRLALQLRAMYDTVAQQPVPDRFADLIARLDDADRGKT